MDVQELLTRPLPTLLVAFFNVVSSKKDNSFLITSKWTNQLKVSGPLGHAEAAKALTAKYSINFVALSKTEIGSRVSNNDGISLDSLRSRLYLAIATQLADLPDDYPLDAEMALALFLLRGSPDTKRFYYAVDVKSPSAGYLVKIEKILMSSEQLWGRLNFNFRDLQPQYVAGVALRNSQIRVNLKWFYENVMLSNQSLNAYKFKVLLVNYKNLGDQRLSQQFENRLRFYRERVLGRTLDSKEVSKLRDALEFQVAESEMSADDIPALAQRNRTIIAFANESFPDLCAGCHDRYEIDVRSFLMPRNDRYYFEINHVVAYSSDSKTVDVLDNLVKLCPTCHRALTPGRAGAELQKKIIRNMLDSRTEVKAFVSARAAGRDMDEIEYVFENLK
ncbi:MAG: hypothetical protein RLZZ164_44 [Actinomycetota bacterium]|jgi:5-methylcytosine-specific restriction protein A